MYISNKKLFIFGLFVFSVLIFFSEISADEKKEDKNFIHPCKLSPVIDKYLKAYPYVVKNKKYYISRALIFGIIEQESKFNPNAESHAGARGLMQIMPRTAKLLGADPDKLYNPEYNIKHGIMFLSALLTEHKGDLVKSISGYNGGSEYTEKKSVKGKFKGRIYNHPETKKYVVIVLNNFEAFKKLKCKINLPVKK